MGPSGFWWGLWGVDGGLGGGLVGVLDGLVAVLGGLVGVLGGAPVGLVRVLGLVAAWGV